MNNFSVFISGIMSNSQEGLESFKNSLTEELCLDQDRVSTIIESMPVEIEKNLSMEAAESLHEIITSIGGIAEIIDANDLIKANNLNVNESRLSDFEEENKINADDVTEEIKQEPESVETESHSSEPEQLEEISDGFKLELDSNEPESVEVSTKTEESKFDDSLDLSMDIPEEAEEEKSLLELTLELEDDISKAEKAAEKNLSEVQKADSAPESTIEEESEDSFDLTLEDEELDNSDELSLEIKKADIPVATESYNPKELKKESKTEDTSTNTQEVSKNISKVIASETQEPEVNNEKSDDVLAKPKVDSVKQNNLQEHKKILIGTAVLFVLAIVYLLLPSKPEPENEIVISPEMIQQMLKSQARDDENENKDKTESIKLRKKIFSADSSNRSWSIKSRIESMDQDLRSLEFEFKVKNVPSPEPEEFVSGNFIPRLISFGIHYSDKPDSKDSAKDSDDKLNKGIARVNVKSGEKNKRFTTPVILNFNEPGSLLKLTTSAKDEEELAPGSYLIEKGEGDSFILRINLLLPLKELVAEPEKSKKEPTKKK